MDLHEQSLKMASRLKELRKESGLSHQKLSEAIAERYGVKISKDSLINYEVADPNHSRAYKNLGMRVEYIWCLADFFNVSCEYLTGVSPIRHFETQGITALDLGFSERAIEEIKMIKECDVCDDMPYLNWLFEHERGQPYCVGEDYSGENYSYEGRLLYNIVKLMRFSEQAHKWPEVQIRNWTDVKLSFEHSEDDSYPVSDLILRDIHAEIRFILNDLESVFTRKGEYLAGKKHIFRRCEIEVI